MRIAGVVAPVAPIAPLVAVIALVAGVGTPAPAAAQEDDGEGQAAGGDSEKGVFGVGLIIGEPTGVSAKYYIGDDMAFDFAAGATFIGRGLQLHGDFLYHPFILQNTETFVFPFYAGAGLRIARRDPGDMVERHTRLGIRAVVGGLLDFREIPIDIFFEAALVGDYQTIDNDAFGLDFNVSAGVRYYF
jgi:hypothetical protein